MLPTVVTGNPALISHILKGNVSNADLCIALLSTSLRICLDEHEGCHQENFNNWIPTRLLEVVSIPKDDGSIRLIERDCLRANLDHTPVKYLTLSHMWGSEKPLMLTRATYEAFQKCIKIATLPRCFRDAVYVTQQLGFSFLWIDSLW